MFSTVWSYMEYPVAAVAGAVFWGAVAAMPMMLPL